MAVSSSSKKAREGGVRARRRVKMASLRRWVRRARVKGLTGREMVVELRGRRGLGLRKVAKVLRVGLGEVREHWWESCEERAARAALVPKAERVLPVLALRSEGDLVALREQVSVALWETVVATFAVPAPEGRREGEGVNEGGDWAGPARPAMVSVRLKALRQLGRLYGLDCKRGASGTANVTECCATREEIAESVRKREEEFKA